MERGLGRGLAAILPGNAERERRQLVPRDRLVDRLLGRCLDRVDQLGAPAVSVAAVERAVGEPIVVLRRPSLADLGPGRAYGIFAALARAGSVGTVDGAGAEVRVDGAVAGRPIGPQLMVMGGFLLAALALAPWATAAALRQAIE